MKATAKYLFDEDFATGEKPTITVIEADRRRADAESQAYRKGFATAQTEAANDAAHRTAAALQVVSDGLARVEQGLSAIEQRLEIEAIEVAVAVANKLAPELIAREPFAEIAALATECFRHLVTTPHVVVHVGEDIYADAKEKLDEAARSRGFEGRLLVHPEAAMAPGDCRIEWAEGGVVRDSAATASAIAEAVGRYVAARPTAHA